MVALKRNWKLIGKFVWERIIIWKANHFHKKNIFAVDIANTGTDITSLPEFQQADIIHLHWINQGMLSLNNLNKIFSSGKPIVWTMHDMWPCTGICHHARECDHYQTECHHCPFINNGKKQKDLSYRIFRKKQAVYRKQTITFVACSHWLEEKARHSSLLSGHHITCIPNPINTNLFKPRNKQEARQRCKLPLDKKLILFGSVKITDKRKGIDYLIKACRMLAQHHPELTKQLGVVTFGKQSQQLINMLPFQVIPLDFISDEHQLVNIYNAVDIFVTPSLEENLPNTIMEAMACGIPCVGFHVGGIPEMIDHLHNGYVARYKSAEDLANGIYWVLTEPSYTGLSEEAYRKVVTHYSEHVIAKRFTDLYNKL
ncbi:glycosyltransferase, group 1 family protein [gut metagenome]|uniref:Glycosyltransferase, group 1 family protein n=1 Tax=gut metagenome TaxID=749906 RepID=J9GST2_9ZZZZ